MPLQAKRRSRHCCVVQEQCSCGSAKPLEARTPGRRRLRNGTCSQVISGISTSTGCLDPLKVPANVRNGEMHQLKGLIEQGARRTSGRLAQLACHADHGCDCMRVQPVVLGLVVAEAAGVHLPAAWRHHLAPAAPLPPHQSSACIRDCFPALLNDSRHVGRKW